MIWQIVGMLAVVTLIAASIALHEFGHLIPAKLSGVRVPEYAIGFGPKLLSRRIGETRYSLRLIPVGGFISMIGMYPPKPKVVGGGRFAQLAEQARGETLAEVLPSDAGRTFYEQPVHKRIAIMLGGPGMNVVFAAVLFGIALIGIGLQAPTATIDTVSPCRVTDGNPRGLVGKDGTCADGASGAARAGLQPGMTITAINGTTVADWESLDAALLQAAKGSGRGRVTVRDTEGQTRTLPINFQVLTLPQYDNQGQETGETYRRAVMGVLMQWHRQHLSPTVVPRVMWNMTTNSVVALASFPEKLVALAQTLVQNGERDPNGPVSVVGATRIGGEIAASEADVWDKVISILMLGGSLNLFLFLFNLVPLLPLDGGHVAAALWEVARNFGRRLRGLAKGGPVDTARMLPLTYAVTVLLVAVGGLVIYADVVKPITLGG